jgi:phage protein D/phage baseplate assembly protein gpV
MSTSELINVQAPLIKIEGSAIDEALNSAVIECVVALMVNGPAMVTVHLDDAELELTNGTTFELGKRMEVFFNDSSLAQVEITSVEPLLTASGRSSLVVRGLHKVHRMHYSRRTASYQNVKDSDIISSVTGAAGLTATVAASSSTYKHVMQWNQTDMEFVLERARRYGAVMTCSGAGVTFAKPADAATGPTITFGVDFDDFSLRSSTGEQMGDVEMTTWDPATKAALVSSGLSPSAVRSVGDLKLASSSALPGVFGTHTSRFFAASMADQAAMDGALQAYVNRVGEELVEMETECPGNPALVAGAKVTIANIGDRFSGTYYMTSVRHSFSAMGFSTTLQASSYEPRTFSELVGSGERRRRVDGVVVGIVTNAGEADASDSAAWGRVRVKFPYLSDSDESWWARLAMPMAGAQRGFQFYPEVDDEVLVAFEDGDPNRPYVIGSLWNGTDALPLAPSVAVVSGKVEKRIIKTRVGHMIEFNDKQGEEQILVQDKAGSYIKFEAKSGSEKVTIFSTKDMDVLVESGKLFISAKDYEVKASNTIKQVSTAASTYEATGDMTIKSTANVNISATSNVKIAATVNAELSASVQLKMSGATMAELSGGTMLKLGGALINIG